jgi:CheY-like chemotaxis protein
MDGVDDRNRCKQYILLIGNQNDACLEAGQLLQKFGYSIYSASTAAAALDFFCATQPAGVVADAALAGLNLLALVRKDPRFSDVPIILMGSSSGQSLHAGIRPTAWVENPVTADTLYRAVQAAIEKTPRKNIRVTTSLKAKVGSNEVGGTVTTLSEFGLFFQVRDLLPIRTEVPISVEIKGRWIRAVAIVLYASAYEEGSSREPGMGMKFITISSEERALVKAFVLDRLNEGL